MFINLKSLGVEPADLMVEQNDELALAAQQLLSEKVRQSHLT